MQGNFVDDQPKGSNIETLRLIAVFSLVSFHTVGASAQDALEVTYPHPLRFMADGLIDVRMPLFAYISGWVYSQRPVVPYELSAFFWAKLRRLYIPGVVAALLFWSIANFVVPDTVGKGVPIYSVLTLSYVHYWFLQAILLIFIGITLVETSLRKPLAPILLIGAAFAFLTLPRIYVSGLVLSGAQYLAPFFIMGVLFARCEYWINQHRNMVAALALFTATWGLILNLDILYSTGELSLDRRDLQSVLLSSGLITLLALFMPRLNGLSGFGSLAFTIYLYHVFGTSGMRRLTQAMEIEEIWTAYVLCVAAGFAVPFVIHTLCLQTNATRAVILGLRPLRTPIS